MQGVDTFAFGRFSMDLTRRVLLVDGQPVALHARAFDILEYLVASRDRPVTRDEIVGHVWRGVVVGENNLSVQMSTLRRVLAAHGGADLIVTVPHRGYQFVERPAGVPGDTNVAAAPGPLGGGETKPAGAEPTALAGRRRPALRAGAVIVLLIAAAIAWKTVWPVRLPSVASGRLPFSPPPHSIAVLAFSNMSGDPKQDYLSEGLSDELIDSLSRLPNLHVVARTSSFYFKGKPATIEEIAHRLNVVTVLEGSVRRVGSTLRVTAHLTDATTGYELWSDSFDREQGDILAIQRDIARAVALSLQSSLAANDLPKLSLGRTTNPKAFDAYLRGVNLCNVQPGEAGDRKAIAAFDEAIAIDPNFAVARVVRALTLADLVDFGGELRPVESMRMEDEAFSDTNRAIEIAPAFGLAYMARANVELSRSLDFAGAAADFVRARTLSPDNPKIDSQYALFEIYLGHIEEGSMAAEHAVLSDPLSVSSLLDLAEVYDLARRYNDALTTLRRAEALGEPGPTRGRGLSGFISLGLGKAEDAYRRCAPGHDLLAVECTIIALHRLGRIAEAEASLSGLRAFAGDAAAYNYAEIFAQWGKVDEAVGWLKRAFELRDGGLLYMKVDPFLDPIRETKEFKDIEHRMNFPP